MIFEMLSEGANNAITGKAICEALNISPRDLTEAIERERRQGKPIAASTGSSPGYFIAANKMEMQQYCDSLLHRAWEIRKTHRACKQTIPSLPEAVKYV